MRSSPTAPATMLLFLLVWLSLWLPSCVASTRAQPARTHSQPATNTHDFPPILGRGVDRSRAEQDALKKAKKLVDDWLSEMAPPVAWRPPVAYIQQRLFKGEPARVPDKDERLDEETTVECWRWSLAVTPQDWYDIKHHDRQARAGERMSLLARFLAGLVGVFAIVAGYIRADDWTKGYYTGWLRAAGIAALALLAGVVCWLP